MKNLLLKQFFSIVILGTVLFFVSFAYAQDNQQNNQLEKIAALGPGVYNVKVDEKTGKVISLLVVGTAPVCSQLSAMKIDNAEREASIYCAAQFARWLAGYSVDYTTEIVADNDGKAKKVEKYVEKDNEPFEVQKQIMSLFLEHAQTLYMKADVENEEIIIVKGLIMKNFEAAKRAIQILDGRPAAFHE